MTYLSALPLAASFVPPTPFPSLGKRKTLADLVGPNKAAEVMKLGDLAPTAAPLPDTRPMAPGTMLAPPRSSLPLFGADESQPLTPRLGGLDAGPAKLGDLVQPVDPSQWRTKHPKFFSKDGAGPIILGALGDALMQRAGMKPTFMPFYQAKLEDERAQEFDRDKWQRDLEAKREDRLRPRIEQVGNTLGWLNEGEGTYSPFFTTPQPFEQFAKARGFEPGTPEYAQAVEDYRLGSWSDPAMENKTALEGVRFEGRRSLQNDRLNVTRRGQDMRSADTRRGQDLTDTRGRRGQDMTDRRVRDLHGRKVGGQSVSPSEPMTRLSNGDYAVVRNGRWVSASTGQPVQ